MMNRWAGWAVLLVATVANFRLFLSRWAEPAYSPIVPALTDAQLSSLTVGIGLVVVTLACADSLRSRRWVAALAVAAISAGWVGTLYGVPAFEQFFPPLWTWCGLGGFASLVCFSLRDSEDPKAPPSLVRAGALFAIASLNAFLLLAPASSHLPSYVQDGLDFTYTLRFFYLGSVHSDRSPVSIIMRAIINAFFSAPSINATALSSMIYVSVALGFAALSVQLAFGRIWAWMFLALCWTDRWILVSAFSSALLGQPMVSTAGVLFLAFWALSRLPERLSWREAVALGVVNAFGLTYNLYSYSAARMTWLVGSGLAALILFGRRSVWFNRDGCAKMATALAPSVLAVVIIWAVFFERDTARFRDQLLISPKVEHRIASIETYPEKLVAVHDPDVPIWWGTARSETRNVSYYWRRSPAEVYEKLVWFFGKIGSEFLPATTLVFLSVLGVAIGLFSASRQRRAFTAVLAILTIVSFSTYVLAQDHGAYRRSLATEVLLSVACIALFAVKARPGRAAILPALLCGALVVFRAPFELNALSNRTLYAYVCPICNPHVDVRVLARDPAFLNISQRKLHLLVEGGDLGEIHNRCTSLAFDSSEFRDIAPNSSILRLGDEELTPRIGEIAPGDIIVASCQRSGSSDPTLSKDPEVRAMCDGNPTIGKLLARIPPEPPAEQVWWALVER